MITTQGDISTSTNNDNIKQMIRVRIGTIPDTYIFGDDLGSELGTTIDEPLNPTNIALIQQYVSDALSVDPRVQQINSINVTDPNDGTMRFFVSVNVTVAGYGDVSTTVPIGGGTY
ncbi:hypothetical protein N007_05045 [Alicyclobacillus acidoterrestris ATCC 49025]|nr:hypothetical protein N007_05045 [Alicyclobacillus acidoterrestris ATCC 49025]